MNAIDRAKAQHLKKLVTAIERLNESRTNKVAGIQAEIEQGLAAIASAKEEIARLEAV